MAIAKKPKRNQTATGLPQQDNAAEAFIAGADSQSATTNEDKRKVPVMMRFDREVLTRVDAAAKRRGISRSAGIQFSVSRALDQGEG